jgi:predicted DNA-binding protein (MmcQ/YjbR family)
MNYKRFNKFCGSLPATTYVMQWGGSHVWKVGGQEGGKVFAVGGWVDKGKLGFTFKVSPLDFEVLQFRRGVRPAPYLASRGMEWLQYYAEPGLSDAELKDLLRSSHRLASLNLTKKRQKELGLNQD